MGPEQLTQKALGCALIAFLRHQNVKRMAVLINGSP
jgi:hypothetical protein